MEWVYLWRLRGGGGVRNGVGLPLACPWRGQKWSGVTSRMSVLGVGSEMEWGYLWRVRGGGSSGVGRLLLHNAAKQAAQLAAQLCGRHSTNVTLTTNQSSPACTRLHQRFYSCFLFYFIRYYFVVCLFVRACTHWRELTGCLSHPPPPLLPQSSQTQIPPDTRTHTYVTLMYLKNT